MNGELCRLTGVKSNLTSAYHPQSNGKNFLNPQNNWYIAMYETCSYLIRVLVTTYNLAVESGNHPAEEAVCNSLELGDHSLKISQIMAM